MLMYFDVFCPLLVVHGQYWAIRQQLNNRVQHFGIPRLPCKPDTALPLVCQLACQLFQLFGMIVKLGSKDQPYVEAVCHFGEAVRRTAQPIHLPSMASQDCFFLSLSWQLATVEEPSKGDPQWGSWVRVAQLVTVGGTLISLCYLGYPFSKGMALHAINLASHLFQVVQLTHQPGCQHLARGMSWEFWVTHDEFMTSRTEQLLAPESGSRLGP